MNPQFCSNIRGYFRSKSVCCLRWDEIGSHLKGQKRMLLYLALGAFGLVLVGIAIGGLFTGGFLNVRPNTGRLVWNFDDPFKKNTDYFLVMTKGDPKSETRIGGFQVLGKNTSGDPVFRSSRAYSVSITQTKLNHSISWPMKMPQKQERSLPTSRYRHYPRIPMAFPVWPTSKFKLSRKSSLKQAKTEFLQSNSCESLSHLL